MPDATYRLTMRKGPDIGQQFPLEAEATTIGRDPAVDLVINDPEVSRQHARLTRRGDHFLVQDLGSTNGTFLDGRRLAGDPVPLAPGQVITIGSNVSLVFEGEAGVAATVLAVEEPAPEEEEPSTELAVGVFDFPEELEPVWPDEDELPVFDRVETTPLEERDTVLDYPSPPHDLSYQEEPEDLLPDFGPPATENAPSQPYLRQERVEYRGAPPPPPPEPPRSSRTRNIVLIVLALLLLCCCCLILTGYYWWGDLLMEYLGLY